MRENRLRFWELDNGEKLRLDLNYLPAIAKHSRPGNPYFDITVKSLVQIQQKAKAAWRATARCDSTQQGRDLSCPSSIACPLMRVARSSANWSAWASNILIWRRPFVPVPRRGERLFFENDGHPNAAGYRLIAEQTAAYLKSATTPGAADAAVHVDHELTGR